MKPSRHFVVLMLSLAMLPLAIILSTTKSAQAAPHTRQAAEERIKATLEDANQSLGGGFVLDPNNSAMTRTTQRAYSNGDPAAITDYLSITSTTPNTYCNSYPEEFWRPNTFHGMDGCSLPYGDHPANVIWEAQDASGAEGNVLVLDVGSIVDECYCFVQHPQKGHKVSDINALPMAEALNQAAIKNGLYEPMPGEVIPNPSPEAGPGQPGVPTDQSVPADAGGLFGIPWPIMLGNLSVPVVGALAGAAVSGIVAGGHGLAVTAERWTAGLLPPLVELFPFDVRLDGFKADMQKIDDLLIQDKKYVVNTWQGYPLLDGATSTAKSAADELAADANWVGSELGMPETKTREGWTCHDYVTYAHGRVQEAAESHFPGATVTKRRLVEQSTLDVERGKYGPLDYLDWKVGGDAGHILDMLETKHGTPEVVLGVDFWSHNAYDVPIVRPYDEATKIYRNAVGLSREYQDVPWTGK